ncbi:UvrD-helicase domain-containing protein [Cellulomonas cellasea]|uniref:DNA 3'-5' helicase n=1 Tax=Cellulomonas cellasea TaxID=43670 RepID=A0A7W4YAF8_9CELL|nr:UvrD-helicase domain-containing protein [Cellulomonas cellasea]MBB2922705.1 DNA helicase-2/ATP-dependent DNA helicase PcrA [Cellulomonas cellasea]
MTPDNAAAPAGRRPVLSAARIAELLERPSPTPEQVEVIESPLRPSLVVAGAGSGKTETMAARVVWLLANGLVAPEQVLGLTFTRKAAGELGDRVRQRLRHLARAATAQGLVLPGLPLAAAGLDPGLLDLARPTIATYNAYAASLVTDHAMRLGVEPTSRLLGEAAQWQLASQVVESWTGDLDTEAAVSTVVEALLELSGALDEHLLTPDEARAGIEGIIEAIEATPPGTPPRAPYAPITKLLGLLGERTRLLELVADYRARKRAADALDFGDQVALAARLAREVPEVGSGERARYRVVLLDEYQDTSYAQLALLGALFGDGHPVTAVGDPHQSIYGWRGASAGGLERFPSTFPVVELDEDGATRRPADVHLLSTSWRNDEAILEAANHVALPLRRASTRVEVPELAARPGAGPGLVQAHVAATLEEEAAAVARFVAERWRPAGPGVARVTAAVLCRKRAQFTVLRRALRDAGLPVEVVGLGGLLATPEVVDLVAMLQAAHDPSRGDALMRLLTGARTRLGAADLHALAAWSAELAAGLGHARRAAERRDAERDGTGAAGSDGTRSAAGDVASRAADRAVDPSARAADAGDRAPGAPGSAAEPVAADVVDERSIVDAVDELPPPGWRSRTGRTLSDTARARLTDLAQLLRVLRSHTYLSLPELVGEAERLLGLDIEVAARAGVSAGRARAHLDAFRDVAVQFSDGADSPTLGAFLAWLAAADTRERGLDMPVAEPDPDAVQIVTIHAAKGLEWDVVAVAGMVDGGLPAIRTTGKDGPTDKAWLSGLGTLPYPLRGDRHDLPQLAYAGATDPKDLEERRRRFVEDAGQHAVAEERRLAYVALTRARSALLLTGAWWGEASQPRPPSLFLTELAEAGLVDPEAWAAEPEDGATSPRGGDDVAPVWPADPFAGPGGRSSGTRRAAVEASAQAVREAIAAASSGAAAARASSGGAVRAGATSPAHTAEALRDGDGPPPDAMVPTPWDRTADLLLAERALAASPSTDVELPPHLSASAVVRLASDPQEFARALRRPVPLEPSPQARRGTAFHAWVEGWFGSASLVDVDDLPGADDDSVRVDADLVALREAFLATPWAHRVPLAVEVDIETPVAGYVLRSRIDAVFADPDRPDVPGAVVVVDWKTGAPPTDPAAVQARELQLAVYRLAWSRWKGTPLEHVSAAFCYVGGGRTVRPERLLDEAEITALLHAAAAQSPRATG